ncbi:hypothetical protein [Kocuria tytonis]|uniref:hypothetical protein n=1 Tax=Kocuria tytonis TaxID=2054280 RepID=UPI0011C46FF7|nr:hypothetical protein [Kocuria tytonis]
MLIAIAVTLVVFYYVVRAACISANNITSQGTQAWQAGKRAGGLYLDNLGRINGGLGVLSPHSDAEKERLRDLKDSNEELWASDGDPEWVMTELEKINEEVRKF